MDPRHYVRTLKRRWRLILGCILLGGVVGIVTAVTAPDPAASQAPEDRFLATNILLSTRQGPQTTSLDRVALFATVGEVPERVAERLGGDPSILTSQTRVFLNGSQGTVSIAAIGTDPRRAEQLANTFSEELVKYLDERAAEDYANRTGVLDKTLAERQKEIDALTTAGLDPTQVKAVEQQRKSLESDLKQLQKQLDTIRQTTSPDSGLTPLAKAKAAPATPEEIDQLKTIAVGTRASGKKGGGAGASNGLEQDLEKLNGTQQAPDPMTRGLMGAGLGLLLGTCLTLVLDRFDTRIRNKIEAEEAFDLPVIAEIPPLTKSQRGDEMVIAFDEPRSLYAEAMRALRSTLVFASGSRAHDEDNGQHEAPDVETADADVSVERPLAAREHRAKVIMITSPGPSEGKTTTSANLAAILAEGGLSVLAVNCDFRRPRLHVFLGGRDDIRKVVDTQIPGVKVVNHVLDETTASPSEVVVAQRKVIERAAPHFDVILLDTAPLLTTNDAIDLIPVVDLVVLIAGVGRTTHEAAFRATEMLQRRGAPVAGVALVGADETPTYHYYYYYSRESAPTDAGTNGDEQHGGAGDHSERDRVGSATGAPMASSS